MLVATDLAARGLHVGGLGHVVNFDLPHEGRVQEQYPHRVGRTGRGGRVGTALTLLVANDEDEDEDGGDRRGENGALNGNKKRKGKRGSDQGDSSGEATGQSMGWSMESSAGPGTCQPVRRSSTKAH